MGSEGYKLIDTLDLDGDDCILEVGTGVSTKYLSHYGHVFTIDLVTPNYQLPRVVYINGLAENVLRNLHVPFRFAWLDGHDWPFPEIGEEELDRYRRMYEERGQELTCEASRRSHWVIASLVLPLMKHDSLIVFDDTWRVPSGFEGKGGDAVPYLLKHSCVVIDDRSTNPCASYVAVHVP